MPAALDPLLYIEDNPANLRLMEAHAGQQPGKLCADAAESAWQHGPPSSRRT